MQVVLQPQVLQVLLVNPAWEKDIGKQGELVPPARQRGKHFIGPVDGQERLGLGVVLDEPLHRLVVSGLTAPPAGKAYELWVIADEPVPAGVFRPDATGRAVVVLPLLDATAQVKTFAVTVEPEDGTASPTGPMVLAGNV